MDVALGSGAGAAEVGEGADSEEGVILRRFGVVSPSTVSSSLSRLSPRGLSIWREGGMVGVTGCAGAAPASPSTMANGGAIATEEDGKGEDDDDGGGGIGFAVVVVTFFAVATPHAHFSRRTVAQIHVSFSCSCAVSGHEPAPTCPQVSSQSVCVPSVPSEPT